MPAPFGRAVTAIGWAANILAVLCLYDLVREGLGAYQYGTAIPLLAVYKGVLGIYAASRQAQLWQAPGSDAPRGGHYFILAWLALPPLLFALELGRLWNPPPLQPADLSEALNWVLGFYVFGKVGSVVRTRGFKPLGILPRQELPPEKEKAAGVLKLGVDVLGAVCLFEVLREAITPPNQSAIDIHGAYRAALAAYAGTRAWRKWASPDEDDGSGGHWWVAAWLAVVVGLKGLEWISSDNLIVMPRHLSVTLLWVFSIYGLGKGLAAARRGSKGLLGSGAEKEPVSLAWLWAFLVFLGLAVVSIWRDVPVVLPRAELVSSEGSRLSAAVLPFADGESLEAVRRDGAGSLVCELAAASNHLGGLDGRSLARLLAAELAGSGVFEGVRFVSDLDGLGSDVVVIRGKVLEGVLRIGRDGKRSYELGVELSAQGRGQKVFFKRTVRRTLSGGKLGAAYEVGALVRKVAEEVVEELGEAVGKG